MPMKKNQLKEKDLLTGKLLSYSAAAGALFALGQDADAQVVYYDVDPDSTVVLPTVLDSANIFEIDMNNDGTVDVTVVVGNGDWYYSLESSTWMSIRALNGSGASLALQTSYLSGWGATYYFPKPFDMDAVIGPDESWGTYSYSFQMGWLGTYVGGTTYNTGPWLDAVDKYLGVRFSLDEGTSYHYGWVRLDVEGDMSEFTVKDYAYEQTADLGIRAGHMVTSVRNGLANDLGVKIFSHQDKIVISDLEIDHATADVYNVAGQLVRSVQVETGRNEVPMDNKGLYIVRIDMGSEIISSKVIVQ